MWPFDTRLRAELDAVKADRERIRGERNQFLKDRDAAQAAAKTAAAQFAHADEELTATRIVNNRLTEDLAKERQVSGSLALQIHAMAQPLEPDPDAVDWPAKYEAMQERAARLEAELDDARLLASRLTAAVESRQQEADLARAVDGAPLVRRQEQRLSDMQDSHVADTRELYDLRQNGAAS